MEMLVAEIWAEALELADIGRDDDFFSLGGDSLIGAIVLAQVDAALGIELSLCTIADHADVSLARDCVEPLARAARPGRHDARAQLSHQRSARCRSPEGVSALSG